MQKNIAILGLSLLVLAGFPLIFRILSTDPSLSGFSNHSPDSIFSREPEIQIMTVLSLMGVIALQSIGIIMITVIDAISPPSKKETPPIISMDE